MTTRERLVHPAVLAADPALPARDELLDGEATRRRLPSLLGLPAGAVGPVSRMRVKYQPGRSLRVAHAFAVGSQQNVLATRMVSAQRWPTLAANADGPRAGQQPGSVAADPALGTVSWLFPRDRRMATLEDVWRRVPPVRAAVGPTWAASRLVAYAPEKSATLRCLDDGGRAIAYAKVYAREQAAHDAVVRIEAAAGLPPGGPARVPRLLAVLPERHLLVFEAVRGTPLDALPPGELAKAATALGEALAAVHRLPAAELPALSRFQAESLQAAAQLVAQARPDVAGLARDVAAALCDAAAPAGAARTPGLVHGDAHLPNALLTGDVVTLIDLDQAAAGPPAADVASVLAGLRRDRLVGALPAAGELELARRLLGGYERVAPLDEHALRWHLAATLLVERAARAVTRVQSEVLQRLGALLAEALDVATGGPLLGPAASTASAPGAGR